jgi:hypothetical protein
VKKRFNKRVYCCEYFSLIPMPIIHMGRQS